MKNPLEIISVVNEGSLMDTDEVIRCIELAQQELISEILKLCTWDFVECRNDIKFVSDQDIEDFCIKKGIKLPYTPKHDY